MKQLVYLFFYSFLCFSGKTTPIKEIKWIDEHNCLITYKNLKDISFVATREIPKEYELLQKMPFPKLDLNNPGGYRSRIENYIKSLQIIHKLYVYEGDVNGRRKTITLQYPHEQPSKLLLSGIALKPNYATGHIELDRLEVAVEGSNKTLDIASKLKYEFGNVPLKIIREEPLGRYQNDSSIVCTRADLTGTVYYSENAIRRYYERPHIPGIFGFDEPKEEIAVIEASMGSVPYGKAQYSDYLVASRIDPLTKEEIAFDEDDSSSSSTSLTQDGYETSETSLGVYQHFQLTGNKREVNSPYMYCLEIDNWNGYKGKTQGIFTKTFEEDCYPLKNGIPYREQKHVLRRTEKDYAKPWFAIRNFPAIAPFGLYQREGDVWVYLGDAYEPKGFYQPLEGEKDFHVVPDINLNESLPPLEPFAHQINKISCESAHDPTFNALIRNGFNNLTHLDLTRSNFSDTHIVNLCLYLTGLKSLNISYSCGLTDTAFCRLGNLTNLTALDMKHISTHENRIKNDTTYGNLRCLTNLKELVISGIRDGAMAYLSHLVNLESLTIDSGVEATRVTDAGVNYITCLTKLKNLVLAGQNITGRTLNGFRNVDLNLDLTWCRYLENQYLTKFKNLKR